MGSVNSQEFIEILNEDEDQVSPASAVPQRVLRMDPRSPTVGINRTPIQVEKTPDADLNHVAKTPQQEKSLPSHLDPRSPTTHITRTPLQLEKVKLAQADPRSPTVGICRTPLVMDKAEVFPVEDGDTPLSTLNLDDSGLDLPPLELPPDETDSDNVTTLLLNRSASEPDLTSTLPAKTNSGPNSDKKVKPLSARKLKKRSKPKSLFPLDSSTPPRSPLAFIDSSSPRVIMQKKQLSKFGLHRHGSQALGKYQPIVDKENLQSETNK
ncbi:cell division cycle-associated protein 3-like [Lingula anatina]|uniref:Cell division cycle-associated protein 3 n=1 Tax=Lingula anatina TaxID=7574 RepID=A0A1S3HWV4_LINAN|nr:cell division cycle-associated protein 3 [Lingula anatina]XP_013390498.1 cell division cycle-associated protein 3 [Lingula anatina]XP_013417264.1 cell division cycle-associated protein 3-like [Lingula anatina]XP_013417348.1 cell division cycle-associated protein 3-like [Lingula anatina]|eukprot:XP_013390490.1 cell division cycle-associated protein 3 [Lingula anatina]